MVDAYARLRRSRDAEETVEAMRGAGHTPSKVSITSLMKAYVEAGEVDAAWRALEELSEDATRAANAATRREQTRYFGSNVDKDELARLLAEARRTSAAFFKRG